MGLGASGRAAAKLAVARDFEVSGVDESKKIDTEGLDKVAILADWSPSDSLPECDLIVVSPGIAPGSPLGLSAAASGAPVVGELEFASYFVESPILAVTGTNGKTTTTEMTQFILGDTAVVAGNIGKPLSEVALDEWRGTVVVEASSFQLESVVGFSPIAAALLNTASDHMDRYSDFQAYVSAKFAVFNNIANASNCVLNFLSLDHWGARFGNASAPTTFSAVENAADAFFDGSAVFFKTIPTPPVDLANSRLNTSHNVENFMAAVLLASRILESDALSAGIDTLLRDFRLGAHRQELVAEFDGVRYVNDSKATNPHALFAALDVFGGEGNILLIAGGLDKNMDFSISKRHSKAIRTAFLIGEAASKIGDAWGRIGVDCRFSASFETAVRNAMRSAVEGDVVLLAPGCASMDMFANYKERGDFFRKIMLQTPF
ncbi:MAG: UDP-N-acetylmuramoyl-L-alanine--D-glutamate ligase [Kiritimatiellaeota bacterium]|nr:UDP-N-acetylmuramoyl-L-alanine--D-glutamate ligase [Kiritimatiellota bacterium]